MFLIFLVYAVDLLIERYPKKFNFLLNFHHLGLEKAIHVFQKLVFAKTSGLRDTLMNYTSNDREYHSKDYSKRIKSIECYLSELFKK